MAFVNEEISEEDKLKLNPANTFEAKLAGHLVRLSKWTVDHDRQSFLIFLRGARPDEGMPELYAFGWKGTVIVFSAYVSEPGNFKEGIDLSWDVFRVEIPSEFESQRSEILRAIQEALDAHGRYCNRQGVKSVAVNFR